MASRLNKSQKEVLFQFKSVIGGNATDKDAIATLKSSEWDLEVAIDTWFTDHPTKHLATTSSTNRVAALHALFDVYHDTHQPDLMLAEGVGRLCDDLGVDPSDISLLVLSYHLDADIMCQYSRSEFVQGLDKLGVDSIASLKSKLPGMREELKREEVFKNVYMYAFSFAREQGQKILQLETALGMWQLLFANRTWPNLTKWLEFVQEKHGRAISKDTWSQFYHFTTKIKPDFSNYDADQGAWPVLMDDFVAYVQRQH